MMQVLNGLLSRDDAEEARTIPLGIIPAGSDNSLVWTVLGIRDPTSAAVAIVKVHVSLLYGVSGHSSTPFNVFCYIFCFLIF